MKNDDTEMEIEICVRIYLVRMASGDGGRRVSSESIAFHSFKHDCSESMRSS